MKYLYGDISSFADYVRKENKKIIIWGAGAVCKTFVPYAFNKYEILDKVVYIIDNNVSKQGSYVKFFNQNVKICSSKILVKSQEDYVVLISNGDFYSVINQLNKLNLGDEVSCFIAAYMQLEQRKTCGFNTVYKDFDKPQIPKTIHYCWFSGNPIPQALQKCIDSWKVYCPDYEIIQWNESNYDISKYNYTKEAHLMKKWGYIPDVVRLDILYEMGGFYFDTDVEICKSLDALRFQEAFCGRERMGHVNFGGGSGCVKGNTVVKELLDFRKDESFDLGNGKYNSEASGYYETFPLMKKGLKIEDVNQKLDGINIYASEFFSPYNFINGENIKNENTFSIHYFSGSWIEGGEKLRKETREKYEDVKNNLVRIKL